MNSSYTPSSTITRLVAVQRCPVEPKAPCTMPPSALSRSASASRMTAFLPPISACTFFSRDAPRVYRSVPISVLPVKDMPATSGDSTSALPTLPPGPVIRFSTPGGTPASSKTSVNFTAHSGVPDAGLKMMALPQIIAGAIFHAGMAMGKFHGVMMPTTPRGRRTV